MSGRGPNNSHNSEVFNLLKVGDRIEFKRHVYSHWGIYIGKGNIVHLAGEEDDGINGKVKPQHLFTICGKTFNKARVCIDDFWDVVGQDKAYINNDRDKSWSPFDADTIIQNATQKLGEVGYSLIYSNCEHFVNWCRYGTAKSDQVDSVLTGFAVGAAVVISALSINAIFKTKDSKEDKEKHKHLM